MIQLENITKEFKTKNGIVKAVDGINLHVKKVKFMGLLATVVQERVPLFAV